MHSVGCGTDVWKHSCETLLFLVTLSFLEANISPRLYYSMSSSPRSSSSAAALEQEGARSLSWLWLTWGAGLMGWWAAGRLVAGTGDKAVNEMGSAGMHQLFLGQGEAKAAELSGIRLAGAQLLQTILYSWPSMPYIKYCSCLGLVSRWV